MNIGIDSIKVGIVAFDSANPKVSFIFASGDRIFLSKSGTLEVTVSGPDWIEGLFSCQLEEDVAGVPAPGIVYITEGKFKAAPFTSP